MTQVERTALRHWIWSMSTLQIRGAQRISSSSPNSSGQSARPSDLPLFPLAKSSPAMWTSTTPMRKTNGETRGVTAFSLTHMPTVSSQEAGERKKASVGQGNQICPLWFVERNMKCRVEYPHTSICNDWPNGVGLNTFFFIIFEINDLSGWGVGSIVT